MLVGARCYFLILYKYGCIFFNSNTASFVKMSSYFLLTLTFVFVALFANQQVSAAAAGNQQACINTAYAIYDTFTSSGCNVERANATSCGRLFDFAIKNLNTDLDKCVRSDYVTLCLINPGGGFFSFSTCSSLSGGGKLTKEECEAYRKIDQTFTAKDGSKTLFKAENSRCINTINYNCHNLCN